MKMQDSKWNAPFRYPKVSLEPHKHSKKSRAKNMGSTIKRIGSYLAQEKGKLFLVILMVVASSALSLLGPFMIGMAIDHFIVTQQASGLGTLLIGLVFIYVFHSLSVFLQNYWMVGVAQNTVFSLRKDLFEQFHLLPISYFDQRQQGELMSRLTNDIDNINNTLNQSVIQIFSSILTLVGTLIIMLYLSPILTVVAMSIVPAMILAMRWITRRTGPLYKAQQLHLGEVNGYVEEIVSGQHVVKTYSQEDHVIEQFEKRNRNLKEIGFWAQNIAGFIPKIMNTLNYLSFALIAFIGGALAIYSNQEIVTIGIIVIFAEYARQFTRPLNELSNQFNILLSAIAGAERVFHVLDETPEKTDETDAVEIDETDGHIVFDQVTFGYGDTPILKDVTFEAKPGETVAFVGHTGAGKTTIINLISRFYNYDSGKLTLDGTDIKKIKRTSLRKQMGFVLQDAFLFDGTIRENIRYGRLNASDEEVVQAAKDANAHDFIETLADGYDTILDQDGSGISQGQKQLLTIARALIADPKILILDEATSNIDTITELKIQDALKRLMKGRTSFVIAHRLNTIQEADTIIMLENGKIIEKGSPDELIQKQGHYYQLHQTQLAGNTAE
jgi:ATP-binding cassette subfamily B protein